MKKFFVIIVMCITIAIFVGCKKKEEQPVPRTSSPHAFVQKDFPSPHGTVQKGDKKVVIPNSIKLQWKKVKFIIEDKATKKNTEYEANIGSELDIPVAGLKVVVGEFLPDFKMDGDIITSASDKPNNPAVRVEIFEKGRSIFKGWLYARFPEIHPFVHEKYGIYLKEGIKG